MYIKIPKDLEAITQKTALNLTTRQLICFAPGIVLGLLTYWATYKSLGTSTAGVLLFIVGTPFFILGLYKNATTGDTLEQTLAKIIRFNLFPKIRLYRSENIYRQISNEIEYIEDLEMLRTGKKKIERGEISQCRKT